mmetsp:Transcript_40507/g.126708  ORF Transcript_40507/g.126708 Transcript_40507/m.126708 type:complete len:297 (-) Transcript_40507:31-921(-)
MDPDELYTLRNHFYVGNYQLAISEATNLSRLPAQLKTERDEYLYRSYIALGQPRLVIGEVGDGADTPVSLQAVKLLARYVSAPESKDMCLLTLDEWLKDASTANNPTLQLVAATIFMREDDVAKAIQAIHLGTTLEQVALMVQIFLKMDRPDLAKHQLRIMQQADEDASLTQLAAAWIGTYEGGAKVSEAAYTLEELMDKFGRSILLLNATAAAKMRGGLTEEAETLLTEALDKGPNHEDTLINMICASYQTGKPRDATQRYITTLRATAPEHPFVKRLATLEAAFDRVSAQLTVS